MTELSSRPRTGEAARSALRPMRISIYAAVALNGAIGRDGGLPWRLSSDLRRFKAETMGKPLIMGRKTWESFPRRPLPGRLNIVVTRQEDYRAEGAATASSLADALELAASRGDAAADELRLGHQAGAEAPFLHAFGRAADIEIDYAVAEALGDARAFGKLGGI